MQQTNTQESRKPACDTTQVYVGNVSRDMNYRALRDLLEEYGEIVRLTMKGHFAFAEFAEVEQAAEAIKGVNAKSKGRGHLFLEPSSTPSNKQKKPVKAPSTKQAAE